jgi:hypothetical protein
MKKERVEGKNLHQKRSLSLGREMGYIFALPREGRWRRRKLNKEHQRPLRAKHKLWEALTQAAQLSDDICQGDVGHAFQLVASNAGQRLTAQVPWLDVPCY